MSSSSHVQAQDLEGGNAAPPKSENRWCRCGGRIWTALKTAGSFCWEDDNLYKIVGTVFQLVACDLLYRAGKPTATRGDLAAALVFQTAVFMLVGMGMYESREQSTQTTT